jgi:hypothetical protein
MPRVQVHDQRDTPPNGALGHRPAEFVLDNDFVAPKEDEPADPRTLGPDLEKLLLSLSAKAQ